MRLSTGWKWNCRAESSHNKENGAKAGGDPLDMVFFYNATPKEGTNEDTLPSQSIYRYRWKVPGISAPAAKQENKPVSSWVAGEKVFLKPPRMRCTTPWPIGIVTGVQSEQRLEVNGIPRHVSDVRRVPDQQLSDHLEEVSGSVTNVDKPRRTRHRPEFYGNNIYDT